MHNVNSKHLTHNQMEEQLDEKEVILTSKEVINIAEVEEVDYNNRMLQEGLDLLGLLLEVSLNLIVPLLEVTQVMQVEVVVKEEIKEESFREVEDKVE